MTAILLAIKAASELVAWGVQLIDTLKREGREMTEEEKAELIARLGAVKDAQAQAEADWAAAGPGGG